MPAATRQFGSTGEALVKTAYYDMHVAMGGKMVPFAGYELPVQFAGAGVLKEHLHTRAPNCSSVFDVGHMGQIKWHGKDAVKFLEKMVCGDLQMLKPSEGKLSLIMNEAGCVVDDCVITNAGDHIYMVVNGACKHKDMAHFNKCVYYLTFCPMSPVYYVCLIHSPSYSNPMLSFFYVGTLVRPGLTWVWNTYTIANC